MKNDYERRAHGKADHHATPKPPGVPRLRLIVFGHGASLLPRCRRAKSKCRGPASPAT